MVLWETHAIPAVFPWKISGGSMIRSHQMKGEGRMKIVKILLSIFLPPVAAFLQVGVSTHFWINIILTLISGIPGIFHALWLVLTDRKAG